MAANIRVIGNDTALDRLLNTVFLSPIRSGYVEIGEDNFCMPIYYKDYEEHIRKFQVKDDDVFLAGHPKTGTTWAQEMIWLIVNNLDYAGATKKIYKRFPQLELVALFDVEKADFGNDDVLTKTGDENVFSLAYVERLNSPRCIKTHLHWSLLPEDIQNGNKKPKIISIFRNAEDTCVSLYHHSRIIEGYKGTFEEFCELFLAGRVAFSPFWKQVLSYWQQRDRANMLIIKYKDMKDDLSGVIKQVARFLDKNLTEEQVQKLAQHLSLESMKKNPAVNHESETQELKQAGIGAGDGNSFVRAGKVGGHKSMMSPELMERFEAWTSENIAGTGLSLE